MNKKIKPNVVADVIIVAALIVGCFYSVPDHDAGKTTTEAEPVVVAQMTTTTAAEPEGYSVPDGDTSFKSYMDYRAITNTRSAQYRLQDDCWTDENGLRRCGDDYVIAVGSYYADRIGEKLEITLADGNEFTAVVGDFKADNHTDKTHRYTAMRNGGKNVIEFVVDTASLDKTARKMGDISYINGFGGDVVGIQPCEDDVKSI